MNLIIPLAVAALLALPMTANADIKSVLMPGKVVQGHAKYETDCNKCHDSFSKGTQNRLCLDCHKKVAADIHDKAGFHGRIADVEQIACKNCHTDHTGRNADIVHLDTDTFDHRQTDYALEGAHKGLRCESCHRTGAAYRDAPSTCNGCHRDGDPHRGRLGTACEKCHGVSLWKTARFDHEKTHFPLRGKHKEASCNACHPNERYRDIATTCIACHRVNDVHSTRYGEKCADCHNEREWKEVHFNHDKDTRYALAGAHQRVRCDSCHAGPLYGVKLGAACYDCHKLDDSHAGRYGSKCQSCHNVQSWGRTVFIHDKDTPFPLKGKHKDVACAACHRGDIAKEEKRDGCYGCHQAKDVHKEREGKRCERCHNEQSWRDRVVFDHDLTRFPLGGLHAGVPCEACHVDTLYKGTSLKCAVCHAKDDIHKLRLGQNCVSCHNPNGWRIWKFDHNTQSDYKLDGAHAALDCHTCHRDKIADNGKIRLAQTCNACHRADDAHNGGFGPQCERCHITQSFKQIRFKGRSAKDAPMK